MRRLAIVWLLPIVAVTVAAAGCGGTSSSTSAAQGCLAQHGYILKSKMKQMAVMANEPSENVSVLAGVVHGHLAEVYFPTGNKQARDAVIFMASDLSDWNAPRGVHDRPRQLRLGKTVAGWSSRPSKQEESVFTSCLSARTS
jgi:hypothetical protein